MSVQEHNPIHFLESQARRLRIEIPNRLLEASVEAIPAPRRTVSPHFFPPSPVSVRDVNNVYM